MGVYTYWRRVEPEAVQGLEPHELRALVPFSAEGDRLEREIADRTTVVVSGATSPMGTLLRAGARSASDDPASDDPASDDHASDDYAAWLAVSGADGLDGDEMIGVLAPDEVVKVAEFLSRARPETWMTQFRPELAELVEHRYGGEFDDEWAQDVVSRTHQLRELFGLAAAAGEAVIVMVYA